jgi:hypothetical protein
VIANSTGYLGCPQDIPADARQNINLLELYAILQAARYLGPVMQNKRVFIHTDNISAKAWVNKGTSHSVIAMSWLRELFWLSVRFNFQLTCLHIPGVTNRAADALSRVTDPSLLNQFMQDYMEGIMFVPQT